MTSSNGSQQRKFIIRAIFIKHQSLSSSENLGIVKFYLLKNNEYYIKLISFITFMKFNDFAVKRYVDHEIFHLTRSCSCPSRDKQLL